MNAPNMLPRRWCGIIPSPDQLNRNINSPGLDKVNTRRDFDLVWKWLKLSKFQNADFYKDIVNNGNYLEDGFFRAAISFAFHAFAPIRNTYSRKDEEMVLLYYSGHGLSEEGGTRLNEANQDGWSSSPLLERVGFTNPGEHFSAAGPYLTQNRNVKGGELCLHEVGFCDLYGLLEPWIAAVEEKSTNSSGEKKNKHVVIIADSCYSGKLVEDLAALKQWPGPWNKNGCTVTVQSACNSREVTFGGYFTPCFVHYNQTGELDRLIEEWNSKPKPQKDTYRDIKLPSPRLETTRPLGNVDSENDPVLKVFFEDFQLCLFRDAGFFKFCYLKCSEALQPPLELNRGTVTTFLRQMTFNIIDYKLTKTRNGTPIALFLVHNPNNPNHIICVHIYFNNSSTALANIRGVNLVQYQCPTYPSLLFLVTSDPNAIWHLKPNEHAAQYTTLVTQCKNYVEATKRGRWVDVATWNMGNNQLGVNHMVRMQNRSTWMNKYVENKIVAANSQT